MHISKFAATLALGAAALGLTACATGFPAQVSRYQAMPAPQGQSFYIVSHQGMRPGLEFARYGGMVAQALQAQGYVPAASANQASMLVELGYGVDRGTQEITRDPFSYGRDPFYSGFGWGAYGRPYYSRFGYYGGYSPFTFGWDDPYWYGGGIDSYTVYKSFLDLDIRRSGDHAQLFDGHAKARSTNDNLGVLVPNLIEAMFTGFPGRSGETVKITVPPPAARRPS